MMRNAIFLYLDTFFVASIKVYVVPNDNFVLTNSERELLPPLVYPHICSVVWDCVGVELFCSLIG